MSSRIPRHRDRHERLATANLTLGPGPVVVQRPFATTNRFYRGAWAL